MMILQDLITDIWESVLEKENINLDDNFFDIGGTSIQALKIIELAKEKGIKIPFHKIFTCQTIREISEVSILTNEQTNDADLLIDVVNKINDFAPDENYNNLLKEYYSRCNNIKYTHLDDAKNIFITGATGYLACHIIEQIFLNSVSNVYALVHGNDLEEAVLRFWNIFNYYFPNKDYQIKYSDRIKIVVGDLTKDLFGFTDQEYTKLSGSIDNIIHTAGNINHYGLWDEFEKINIDGTKRIIKFAKNITEKRLNHISTIAVCHTFQRSKRFVPFTEFDTLENEMAENFYVKSKLIAENLVVKEKDNLEVKIFRPSNIVQSYESGIFPYGITKGTLYKVNTELTIINTLIKNNIVLDLDLPLLDFSFIDETAKSIYNIMKIKEEDNFIYNIFNPNKISLSQLALRLNIAPLSLSDFTKHIQKNEHNMSEDIKQLCALTLAEGNVNQALILTPENRRTINLLNSLEFSWHELENKNIDDILNFN